MARYLAFHKPYEVLSQFTDHLGRATLADFITVPGVYAAGRLDYRSEGLLILSDDGVFIQRVADPRFKHPKTYLAQVEGSVTEQALKPLLQEILLPDQHTLPLKVELVIEPALPARSKPVRAYHPTSWLEILLQEGKKHQVRRLTAAIGYPTLRLVRIAIGLVTLQGLPPGEWRKLRSAEVAYFFG